VSTRHKPDS